MKVPFVKMHGNGNDFVIVDNTKLQLQYSDASVGVFSCAWRRPRALWKPMRVRRCKAPPVPLRVSESAFHRTLAQ